VENNSVSCHDSSLASCATEVRGDIGGSNNYKDCTGTCADTEQREIPRNGMSGKCRAFQVHSNKIQYQRLVKLGKWRTHNTGQNRGVRGVDETAIGSMHVVHDRVGSQGNVNHTSGNRRAAVENEGLHGADCSYRACECENEERAHAVGTTIEAALNKMQQCFSDNVQAEASRTSAAQVAQQDILQKIHTALDSNSKRVTELEETQQREIQKMETRIMKQQQAMEQYMRDALEMQAGEQTKNCQREQESEQQHAAALQRLHALEKKSSETKWQENTATTLLEELEVQKHCPPNATATADTDTGTVSAAAQHKRDEVDAPQQVAYGKVSVVIEDDHVTMYKATGTDAEVYSEVGEMITAAATTSRTEGIHAPTEDAQPHLAGNAAAGTLEHSELMGIMDQMQERTTAQAALAHEHIEKLENKLRELTKKLDEVTHVMEEQQFNFTNSNKARELRVDSTTQKLERVDGGETETENVDQTREIKTLQTHQSGTII